jgi:amidase/aspartyl-tRNA(Asn)/glutamyl-tRNA(Gln) amidotransferase subunit A
VAGDPTALPAWCPAPGRVPKRLLVADRFVDWGPLPAAVDDLFREAVGAMAETLKLTPQTIPPGDFFPDGNPDLEWYTICGVEHAHLLGEETIREKADRFDPWFLSWMEDALTTPTALYMQARRRRFEYVRRLDELLGDDAVLLTPTLPVQGILADGRVPGADTPGAPASCYNTMVANVTGHPAISLPAGVSPNGVPFGIQAMTPRFADDMLLNVGDLWEAQHPWPRVAPGYAEFSLERRDPAIRQ